MLQTPFSRRRLAALALTGGASLALTACGGDDQIAAESPSPSGSAPSTSAPATSPAASDPATTPTPTPTVKPKIITDLSVIKVTDVKGKAPKVTGPFPLAVEKTLITVLKPGSGPKVGKGAWVEVNYEGVNGRTGQVFDDSWSRLQTASFSLDGVVAGFTKAIEGQQVGSRVLVTMTGADGYDSAGGSPQAGILKGDCLVFVIDIISTGVTSPTGTAVAPKEGLPTVTDTKGVPTVTIPKTAAPTSLVVQPLVKGAGKKVAKNDAVTVHYRTWDWATGKLLQDDYSVAAGETGVLSGLVKAWQQGLVNQTVGSRVLLVAPPALAYGDAGNEPTIPKKATLVYVVDILFTQPSGQA